MEVKNNIIGLEKKVLDHGLIRVVDFMGEDSSIVQAARVSYGGGTKSPAEDKALIRFLMRHRHTSPFEMCDIKLHLKMPMCIGEQWIRHRTASINKISGRYTVLKDQFYIPETKDFGVQSDVNRQCRDLAQNLEQAEKSRELLIQNSKQCYENYQNLINAGVAREIARMALPANIYTEFYWKCNLHNLLHLVHLRSGKGAQYEIRVYSEAIEEILKEWLPITYEAFVDYIKKSIVLSRVTKKLVSRNSEMYEGLGKSEISDFEENF